VLFIFLKQDTLWNPHNKESLSDIDATIPDAARHFSGLNWLTFKKVKY
jgi:hypothetical protein